MNLKKIRLIFIILILTLSITACKGKNDLDKSNKGEGENISQQKVEGGEINVPITHVKAVNPLLNSSSSLYYFNKLIFEGLFELDKNLKPQKKLVENYKLNPDGSIDITLKKDVFWHDGTELSSEDVKFTVDTIKYAIANAKYTQDISDMYKPQAILDINNISNIEIKDDKNMTIYFAENNGNILEMLTFPIISLSVFDNDYEKALEVKNYKPVGTGPYKQVEYEKLKYVKLKSNKTYWGDKPHIDSIKGKILKDDELSLTSFESGQIDLTFSLETDWEKYSQDEKVDIHEFPSRRYEFLAVNSKIKLFEGENGKQIRKAIAYGINRENIIERVYLGHATKTNTPIIPTSYLSDKNINDKYKYSVKKARDILVKAGYKDLDNDGFYEDEKNNEISIKLSTNSYNELRVKILDMISEDLKNIGIRVEKDYELIDTEGISEEEKQSNWEKFESKINSGRFELALLGWETSFNQDISSMFHSIGKGNFISYENLFLDKVLDNIRNSNNPEKNKEYYIEAQNIIAEDLPYISLFFTNGTVLSNKKIRGDINPIYTNIYINIDEWFIPKEYQVQEK